MSEENTQEVAPMANAESNDKDDLMAEIEQLRSTNERLLGESKSNKTRKSELEELKSMVETYKKRELEEKGSWQERLEHEQRRANELEGKIKDQTNKLLKSNIFNSVANHAKDAFDVNDLLAQRDYASMIEVDEESLEPIVESVQKFVSSLKADKSYLFKGHKVATMADDKPSQGKTPSKDLSKMNKNEMGKYLNDALSGII